MSKEVTGNQRISRGKFLFLAAGWTGITTLASMGLTQKDLNWITEVPEALPERKIPYPLPGWLETSLPDRPALLSPDQGHKEYLRYFCLNHPVLKETLHRAYQDIFSGKIASSPKLGDYLNLHLNYARNSIVKIMGDKNPSQVNIIHVAVMTMAGVLGPYITTEEIENLGVSIPKRSSLVKEVVLVPEFNQFIPKVFPAKPETCTSKTDFIARCEGGDRAVHFAQHLFLTYQMLYVLINKLQDAHRIPKGANLLVKLGGSKERQTIVLDLLAQGYWEIIETIKYYRTGESDYGRGEDGQLVISGVIDPHVNRDIWANTLGAWTALKLSRNPITWGSLNELINALNNPAYYIVT